MIKHQIESRGVKDSRVLEALSYIERHRFVPAENIEEAYDDNPLQIGYGQTISQPYIVAYMTELLQIEPDNLVLEIGTGSGYQTAILAFLAEKVISIERIPELSENSKEILEELNISNVEIHAGDGSLGWPDSAPYNRIIVTAGAPEIPQALIDQLTDGGIMVIPVGNKNIQELYLVTKEYGQISRKRKGGCRFVNLVGTQGWDD